MKSKSTIAVSVLLFSFWGAAPAQAADEHHGHDAAQSSAQTQTHLGRGVIESIDAGEGVVTLEHEAIKSLRWPKMVMDFKAQDPALLKGLKEGDPVEFDLVKMGKEYRVTRIAPLR
jgi:Cu/Ag efflux protein CusF